MVIKRVWLLDPDWLKLLSNEVIAKICCRLKEFIEETQVRTKAQKKSTDYWTKIFQQWVKTRGKNEQRSIRGQ